MMADGLIARVPHLIKVAPSVEVQRQRLTAFVRALGTHKLALIAGDTHRTTIARKVMAQTWDDAAIGTLIFGDNPMTCTCSVLHEGRLVELDTLEEEG